MSRAIRRHHRERLKSARKNYHWWGYGPRNDAKRIARYVDTPCPCSCDGCGNGRHAWAKKTAPIREQRFICDVESD